MGCLSILGRINSPITPTTQFSVGDLLEDRKYLVSCSYGLNREGGGLGFNFLQTPGYGMVPINNQNIAPYENSNDIISLAYSDLAKNRQLKDESYSIILIFMTRSDRLIGELSDFVISFFGELD